ncbi:MULTISPECIES: queuosine precursor transporter [Mumia]|uniref:queuosine precursor transporter n=1 Tax=Mumia TaxID=1546255 RepID=UPI0014235BDD|nr:MULTISPECIES: queuosine precursor transporter [unclassified Mumia]QMW67862.1 queuosine precursor transporter [Mumia sp. ZJ1417]
MSDDGGAAPAHDGAVRYASRGSTHFDVILAAFCVVLVVSNVVATKGIEIGSGAWSVGSLQLWPVITDGGAFLFPLAYVLGDVISEVYGFRAARRAIVTGFAMAIIASVTFWVVQHAPAASFYENQGAYEAVLGFVPQIVLASLAGYVVGQLLNSVVLVRMKARTAERGLFARLATSTGVGELADTLIFCAIAASVIGITTWGQFWNYAVVGFVYKVGVELLVMPVTMLVIGWLKSREPTYWR